METFKLTKTFILTTEQIRYALKVSHFASNSNKNTSQFCNGYLVSVLHYCDACQFDAAQQAEFEKLADMHTLRYYADNRN
tara:strand:- start:20000 stop:20239 length:240 start_codon:yes stop_codon:yes gene_type:complete